VTKKIVPHISKYPRGSNVFVKAVRYHATGGPEVLTYEDAPVPEPNRDEVILRVLGCGVNRIDIWARSGRYKTTLPHILGTDVAGEVRSVGGGVQNIEPGLQALAYTVVSDGTCIYCRIGMYNLCPSRGFIGIATDGGYAEYASVPAANLVPLERIDAKTAAALPVNFGTAWNGLATKAKAGRTDTVLVWGAAGGLGHAAVQVAKYLGAKVIGAVGDDKKFDFVRSQGADYVLNHNSKDFVNEVRSLTDGQGASVVFDHVGGDTWAKSIECLRRGGRMITLGLTSGPKAEVDVGRVYRDELSIIGAYGQTRTDLKQVMQLASLGRLKPSVYRELPLSSAKEAHEILEARDVQGKILLVP
jgi:NADPH2:quinone reductase